MILKFYFAKKIDQFKFKKKYFVTILSQPKNVFLTSHNTFLCFDKNSPKKATATSLPQHK